MDLDSQQSPITSSDDEIDYSVKPEFYDPDLDSKDEIWVRKGRGGGGASDAVLSCPACFTTLCFESQRHETIVTQYRAVFVANCQLKPQVSLRTQQPHKGNRQRGKRKHGTEALVVTEVEEEELFKPVCCAVCDTKVGFMDKDEVYHFVDVIPSEA